MRRDTLDKQTVGGLTDAGFLVRTEDALSGPRLSDSDDVSAYRHASWQNR